MSLVASLEAHAEALAESRVYTWLDDELSEAATLTFAELRSSAMAICYALREAWHISEAERAMLLYPPGLDLLPAFFGCSYAQVIAVPFYPPPLPTAPSDASLSLLADGLAKLRAVAESCTPALFLSTREYLHAQRHWASATSRAECAWPSAWVWRASNDLPAVTAAAEAAAAAWLAARKLPADAAEVAMLQYTSGSTGAPKGVMVSTRGLLANIAAVKGASECSRLASAGAAVAIVSWLPQYHDMGLIGACVAPAVLGWRAELMAPRTFLRCPAAWLRAIARLPRHQVISVAPDFGYALCARRVADEEIRALRLEHWRVAMVGAEPIREATLRLFDARFAACGWDRRAWACVYGLAEHTLYAAGAAQPPRVTALDRRRLRVGEYAVAEAECASVLRSPGCALPAAGAGAGRVAVVDAEARAQVGEGCVGEIWLCGPSVALGYWGCKEAAAFGGELDGALWLRTGDLGVVLGGWLHVVGRVKDVLTVRGRTLHAADVEECVEQSAGDEVRAGCCAAFGVETEEGEALVLLLEPQRQDAADGGAAVARAAAAAVARLCGVKPHAVAVVRAHTVPKTTSGKLRRGACRELFAAMEGEGGATGALLHLWRPDGAEGEPPVAASAPRGGGELVDADHPLSVDGVCLAIRKITFSRVDPDDPIEEMGLDSTDLFELEAELRKRTGDKRLKVLEMLQHKTLRELILSLQATAACSFGKPSSTNADDQG